jgi:hypothetical protein
MAPSFTAPVSPRRGMAHSSRFERVVRGPCLAASRTLPSSWIRSRTSDRANQIGAITAEGIAALFFPRRATSQTITASNGRLGRQSCGSSPPFSTDATWPKISTASSANETQYVYNVDLVFAGDRLESVSALEAPLVGCPAYGLIGRNVLSRAIFTYDGRLRRYSLTF